MNPEPQTLGIGGTAVRSRRAENREVELLQNLTTLVLKRLHISSATTTLVAQIQR